MIVIYSILWVVMLMGILHLAVPSKAMLRNRTEHGGYYPLWILFLALMLTMHYTLMARAGHGMTAIASDVLAAGVYCVGHCGLAWIRRIWCETDSASTDLEARLPGAQQAEH